MKQTRSTDAVTVAEETRGLFARHPSLLASAIAFVAVTLFFWWAAAQELGELESSNQASTADTAARVMQLLYDQRAIMVAASPSLELRLISAGLLSPNIEFDRQAVEELFLGFLETSPGISQVRWLDTRGMERARVNQSVSAEGKRLTRSAGQLQDKSDRDYFRATIDLQASDMFVSQVDLNQELGAIVQPVEPTMRTGVPTGQSLGMRRGALVINFDLRNLFRRIEEAGDYRDVAVDLLDGRNGKIYASSHRPDLAWAHLLRHPRLYYGDVYPQWFQQINRFLDAGVHSMPIENGLVTRADSNVPFRVTEGTLVIHTFVPAGERAAARQQIVTRAAGLWALVLFAAVLAFTQLFRLERENIQAMRRMEELAAVKSQFLANMSHEIRTPITGIMGMLDLLLPELDKPEQREKLQFIQESSRSLRQIVDDILDVSKLQSGKMELESRTFRPAQTLQRVARLYGVSAGLKGIELNTKIPESLTGTGVLGDEFRIEQVLNNLVSNAIKFTASGGVSLELRELGRERDQLRLHFSVRDTGIGIEPNTIEQLCQPFVQADSSTTRKHGGSGLGLSICNSLLALMGSGLQISSEPGTGSEFSFDLNLPLAEVESPRHDHPVPTGPQPGSVPTAVTPAALSGQGSTHPESGPGKQPTTENPETVRERLAQALKQAVKTHGPPRVLVTEDSIAMQVLLRALFESLDIPITVAENGQEALALLDESAFDLVFMDLQMPVMGGIEAISIIRRRFSPEQLPIIVLSAAAGQEQPDDSVAAGGNHFLQKPIDITELLVTLLRFWKPGASRAD